MLDKRSGMQYSQTIVMRSVFMPQPIDEKRDLLIKVAKLYYIEGRSQE